MAPFGKHGIVPDVQGGEFQRFCQCGRGNSGISEADTGPGRHSCMSVAARRATCSVTYHLLQPGPGGIRDAAVREKMISALDETIAGSDELTVTKRAELRGKISMMPGLNRFLYHPGGLLRTDRARAKAEENLDGKYLLRSADPNMTAEDMSAGYKQLLEVERGWRDMKSVLGLRPVYHRLEERIRAHVLLCWLALLLIRVAENHTGQTWPAMRRELQRIRGGTGSAAPWQRTDIPGTARDLLTALKIDVPRKIHELSAPEELIRDLHDEPPPRDTACG